MALFIVFETITVILGVFLHGEDLSGLHLKELQLFKREQ